MTQIGADEDSRWLYHLVIIIDNLLAISTLVAIIPKRQKMADDPQEFQSVDPGTETSAQALKGSSRFSMLAIFTPWVCVGAGILCIQRSQDDWMGFGIIIPVVCGMLAGIVMTLICTVIAVKRNEPKALWAMLALLFYFFLGLASMGGK